MSKPTFTRLAAAADLDAPPASLFASTARIHLFIMKVEEELGEDFTAVIAASLFRVAAVRGLDVIDMLQKCAAAAVHQKKMMAETRKRAH